MKIAEITYSQRPGGAESLVKQLSCEFKHRGHDVVVFLLDKVGDTPYELEALDTLKQAGVKTIMVNRSKTPAGNVDAFLRLRRLLEKSHFDIVHSHGDLIDVMVMLTQASTAIDCRLVSTVHNSTYSTKGLKAGLVRVARNRGMVVYCSRAAMAANTREQFRASTYIENGVVMTPAVKRPHSIFEGRKDHTDEALSHRIVLISVGCISDQKNHKCMIDALKWLHDNCRQDVILRVCGSGDCSNLQRYASDLGVAEYIEFLGARSDVPNLLADSDIFLSTSLWEGLPLAVLEAFNSGISCVLSPIKEHLDIGTDVHGCHFAKSCSGRAVGEAVRAAVEQLENKEVVRHRRAEVLDRYSIERCAEDYIALFHKVLSTET